MIPRGNAAHGSKIRLSFVEISHVLLLAWNGAEVCGGKAAVLRESGGKMLTLQLCCRSPAVTAEANGAAVISCGVANVWEECVIQSERARSGNLSWYNLWSHLLYNRSRCLCVDDVVVKKS